MSATQPPDLQAWRHELLEVLRTDAVQAATGPGEEGSPAADRVEVLAFEVAGETYALAIGAVREIVLPRPVTPVPRTPDFLLGVASLRGTVLPVVDLGRRLGLRPGEPPKGARILVVSDGEEAMGFWVDRVRGVVRFAGGEVEAAGFAVGVDPRFLEGIGYDRQGNLVALLDAGRLCEVELAGP